jgi:membrane protein DedA with SNARE-associated domain
MGSLGLLHGTTAIVVIAALLFAEEIGIPLFFISGDFILLGAGVMVCQGAVNPLVLLPVALVTVLVGALIAFAWSAALGVDRLRRAAGWLHATRHLDRAERKLRAAGSLGILALRFVPGMRVYSTMVVGALRIDLGTFLRGLVPSVLLWVVGFTLLGCLAGAPVNAVLGAVEHYLLEAILVVAAGGATLLEVRHVARRHSGRPAAA